MVKYKGTFKCVILSPVRLIYQEDIESIFLPGDKGEYEILAYHYPLLGVLRKGNLVINGKEKMAIPGGVVRFFANECTILVEEKRPQEVSRKEALKKMDKK
jgi:F0F1-type ATP synthase epsilon subunit